jgi:hypothetical protein
MKKNYERKNIFQLIEVTHEGFMCADGKPCCRRVERRLRERVTAWKHYTIVMGASQWPLQFTGRVIGMNGFFVRNYFTIVYLVIKLFRKKIVIIGIYKY